MDKEKLIKWGLIGGAGLVVAYFLWQSRGSSDTSFIGVSGGVSTVQDTSATYEDYVSSGTETQLYYETFGESQQLGYNSALTTTAAQTALSLFGMQTGNLNAEYGFADDFELTLDPTTSGGASIKFSGGAKAGELDKIAQDKINAITGEKTALQTSLQEQKNIASNLTAQFTSAQGQIAKYRTALADILRAQDQYKNAARVEQTRGIATGALH